MILTFVTINGIRVVIMTDSNLTPSTPEPASTASPSTPSRKVRPLKYIGIPNFQKPRRQNMAATKRRVESSTRISRAYNQRWQSRRTYRMTFTSMSDLTAMFEVEVRVESLRALMLATVANIGRLNRWQPSRHFTVTYAMQQEKHEMHEETVAFTEGHALPATEPRITSTHPIDQELDL